MNMGTVLRDDRSDVLSLPAAPATAGERRFAPVETLWLRLGLAFVFLYAAISASLEPAAFSAYFPSFLPAWAVDVALPLFGIFEVGLALAFLTGNRTYEAALLATATLVGIVIFNPDAFAVLFRNVAIAGATLTLASMTRPPHRRRQFVQQ